MKEETGGSKDERKEEDGEMSDIYPSSHLLWRPENGMTVINPAAVVCGREYC